MKRRKFITQLTLTLLGLPFVSTIRNQEFQSNSLGCISLGDMSIETKDLFIEKGLSFNTSLSVETFSSPNLSVLLDYAEKVNFRLLLIADPSSLSESKLLFSLLLSLTNKRRRFCAYIYLPFNFEGPKLRNELGKLRMHFKKHENIMFIPLSEEFQRYGSIPMRDVFEKIYTRLFYDFIESKSTVLFIKSTKCAACIRSVYRHILAGIVAKRMQNMVKSIYPLY